MKGLERTFDSVATAYDKFRPTYPDPLYRQIFNYITLNNFSRAVEVGIGSGQATLPILRTGCRVTAVECGREFSEICREKFKAFKNFSILNCKFEDAALEPGSFDLVYSATAFHWVPEEVGYPKVLTMLKRGGAFARFANHPFPARDNKPLFDDIQAIYAEFYPGRKSKPLSEFSMEQAENVAIIAKNYGFSDISCALFHRTRTFSASEYTSLLGTYSDHIAIDEPTRMKFFSEIMHAINSHGGSITVFDTIDLQLARKQ